MKRRVNIKISQASAEARRRSLGEKLRVAREYVGLSQDEVARQLGVPRTALTNIEGGLRKVDAIELQRLSSLYKRSVSYFTEEEEVSSLPADVSHLARAAAQLSIKDREELGRFAEYLRTRAESGEKAK